MTDRLRQDQERTSSEEQARQAAAAARAAEAHERAMARVEDSRETRLALAVLLLVLALLAFGGGGILMVKDRQKPAIILGGTGLVLLIAAVIAFLTRPSLGDVETDEPAGNQVAAADDAPTRFAGRNTCELVPERSRVTVSSTDAVPLEWSETGCVNQRTQYARNGNVWTRVLVPGGEQAVSVLQFSPSNGEYVVTRYLLDARSMEPGAGAPPRRRGQDLHRRPGGADRPRRPAARYRPGPAAAAQRAAGLSLPQPGRRRALSLVAVAKAVRLDLRP